MTGVKMNVLEVATRVYEGQKPGTSGLRKKTRVFMEGTYLANFVQCIFDALGEKEMVGCTLLVGGDGRYYNREAIQQICELAAGNGVGRVWVCVNGLCSTPAASCIIREREGGVAKGGILLTASHNPGGINEDFGIKYNMSNGGPAPESVTDEIYKRTTAITRLRRVELGKLDISRVGVAFKSDSFSVEVIDGVEDYLSMLRNVFDFPALRSFVRREDFSFLYDCMNGVAGAYAKKVFVDELGISSGSILNGTPKEDFGGLHPDPNLTYAHELVVRMQCEPGVKYTGSNAGVPVLGSAGDGDCDRNMILGRGFFVTPSDSVAIIADNSMAAIPYFKNGLKGLARSMPTSCAIDSVAKRLGVPLAEVPTGWKFFGNLMDSGMLSICGEESFGTGSDHVREKDGIWATLCWLSVLAHKNKNTSVGKMIQVKDIVEDFWKINGRNFYTRYDYENIDTEKANKVIARLNELVNDKNLLNKENEAIKSIPSLVQPQKMLQITHADNFSYKDPVDNSVTKNQGLRFFLNDGSRIIVRLSGTGSSGATIRVYLESVAKEPNLLSLETATIMKNLVAIATKQLAQIQQLTGRDAPTVIT